MIKVRTIRDIPMALPLPNYLRMFRRRKGITQGQLACLLNLCPSTISRHEQRGRLPSLASARRYEAVIAVSIQSLFPGYFDHRQIQRFACRVLSIDITREGFAYRSEEHTSELQSR